MADSSPTRDSHQDGSAGVEGGLLSSNGGSLDVRHLGELEVGFGVLVGSRALDVVSLLHHEGLDDVDGFRASAVAACHLVVELGNGIVEGVGSVLLVHVDDASAGLVLHHDAVHADRVGVALEDLAHGHNLTLASSDFVLPLHLVPKAGPGKHGVLGENSDSIASGLRFVLTGSLSANNPELSNLTSQHILSKKPSWSVYLLAFAWWKVQHPLSFLSI